MTDPADTDEAWDSMDDDPVCQTCCGSGLYSTCIDDMCHGQEECIHGDDATCPDCGGAGYSQPVPRRTPP